MGLDLGALATGIGLGPQAGLEIYGQHKASRESSRNRAFQKEALQKGIQWRVADAQMAGIHPLFALGAQLQMPAPVQTDFGGYGRAGEAFTRGIDRAAAQRHDAMAMGLIQAQINETNSRAALNAAELSRMVKAAAGTGAARDVESRNLVIPPSAGFKTSPTSTAQTVQDEYGDVIEAIYGIGRLIYDMGLNIGGHYSPNREQRVKNAQRKQMESFRRNPYQK